MRQFGLIGFPLSHSFSKVFFAEKFAKENIEMCSYENYPIENIEGFQSLWNSNPNLEGINITIPHKKAVIPFLHHASAVVQKMQACNCIRKYKEEWYGYNTDVIGFEQSLLPFLKPHHANALILGTGGAAAAVEWVLEKLNIKYQFVSRTPNAGAITYADLTPAIMETHTLIINTTPLGMFPNINEAPELPYEAITSKHHLYDLVYNPALTLFLQKGSAQNATIQNGLEMLHLQAEASWEIWNAEMPYIQ